MIRMKNAIGREGCHWHSPSEEESDELVGNLSRVSRLGFQHTLGAESRELGAERMLHVSSLGIRDGDERWRNAW